MYRYQYHHNYLIQYTIHITNTIIQYTPIRRYTIHLHLDIQFLRSFYNLPQPYHVTHPTLVQLIARERKSGAKEHRNSAKMAVLNYLHMQRRSSLLPAFHSLSQSLHHHPSAGQGHLGQQELSKGTQFHTRTKQRWPYSIIYIRSSDLHSFLSFTHCRSASTFIPLPRPHLSNLTSVHPVPGLLQIV